MGLLKTCHSLTGCCRGRGDARRWNQRLHGERWIHSRCVCGWCPQSRTVWWSGCCSRSNSAESLCCSLGRPNSTHPTSTPVDPGPSKTSQMQTWLELSLRGVCRHCVGGPISRSPPLQPHRMPADWWIQLHPGCVLHPQHS